jgi:hypothetical protein
VPLDFLGIFPLTCERLIFIALVVVLLVLPFLLKVVVAHPDLLKLLEIMMKGINR